ncbi:Clavaminate synthase-like protein [Dacryopinax primogenitus]|uniref:Clavaminate synthase-like protein n=1 Tax=Dacryopinax primogenitus (strain DJM 731) TaxID=1858805 RepID=M5G1S5_DACPD|nr:Clavaminate synthase-like protein [Dacryopinax primogenitus]EJU02659.1 Clavaminate synthase-like protein [Dacryopinax primogenitus]
MPLPVVDLDIFLQSPDSVTAQAECKKAADALVEYGALVVKDSRVSEADNSAFLDLLEDYFAQPIDLLRADERPEVGYQVGVTLANTERPKCASSAPCLSVIQRLEPSERPLDISGHQADPKCRFFWKMQTPPPYPTAYPSLNMQNVVPKAFEHQWPGIMNKWGGRMREAVEGVAEMAAVGFGLERGAFKDAGAYGPHLLAPTASDLNEYGKKDTILAGFHTDLNFLTIHGRSRYPGLHIWARNTGKRIAVSIPSGCLLVQAGRQLEHLTGGLVKAGYHEVVVNEATLQAVERIRSTGRPLIRISSTFFYHLLSDYTLAPIPQLQHESQTRYVQDGEEKETYESMKVGQQVENELRQIALMA